VSRYEDSGPTLETLALDACRLAVAMAEAAEADTLRRMTDHGRIALTPRFVRSLIAARRLRCERLGPALAPEPSWSLLLALYAARLEHWQPTLADLTRAAAAPGATVYGRLKALEASGLLERRPDPARARGTIVALTDDAAARIHDYLREAREI
jgi:DNA-binding MarR family transcriptional regulator